MVVRSLCRAWGPAEVSAVAVHGVTGKLFWAVYTGTQARVCPRHQGGEGGGGDAGSLLLGVLPPELAASHARAWIHTP